MPSDPRCTTPTPIRPVLLAVVLSVTACGGETDVGTAALAATAAPTRSMPDLDAMRARHVIAADAVIAEARSHIAAARTVGTDGWSRRAAPHADLVTRVTATADRAWRELDFGMNRGDEGMGEMFGMSGVEYRQMREQMRVLRAEAGQLQSAAEGEVRQRLPAHLDQLEDFVRRMEVSANHLRS